MARRVSGWVSSTAGRVCRPSTTETAIRVPPRGTTQSAVIPSGRAATSERPRRPSIRRISNRSPSSPNASPIRTVSSGGNSANRAREVAPSETTMATRARRGAVAVNGCVRRHSRHRATPRTVPSRSVVDRRIRWTVGRPHTSQTISAAWTAPAVPPGGEFAGAIRTIAPPSVLTVAPVGARGERPGRDHGLTLARRRRRRPRVGQGRLEALDEPPGQGRSGRALACAPTRGDRVPPRAAGPPRRPPAAGRIVREGAAGTGPGPVPARSFTGGIEWGCPNLNRGLGLPKPEG
jgi:hypothetical protein